LILDGGIEISQAFEELNRDKWFSFLSLALLPLRIKWSFISLFKMLKDPPSPIIKCLLPLRINGNYFSILNGGRGVLQYFIAPYGLTEIGI
jgi:hypothetical protein